MRAIWIKFNCTNSISENTVVISYDNDDICIAHIAQVAWWEIQKKKKREKIAAHVCLFVCVCMCWMKKNSNTKCKRNSRRENWIKGASSTPHKRYDSQRLRTTYIKLSVEHYQTHSLVRCVWMNGSCAHHHPNSKSVFLKFLVSIHKYTCLFDPLNLKLLQWSVSDFKSLFSFCFVSIDLSI